MAHSKAKKKRVSKAASVAVTPKIKLTTDRDTPVYYINYAESSFTSHEFIITALRAPVSLSADQLEVAQKGGTLTFAADIQLIIPPTVIPALIRALSTTQDQYEAATGITIMDVGASK